MRKFISSLLFIITIIPGFKGQTAITDSIKSFSLRNYQSPDIKYRELNLGTSFRSTGAYEKDISKTDFTFQLNNRLNYYQYSFNEKYQGLSTSLFSIDLYTRPLKQHDNKSKSNFVSTYIDYFTQSRIYYPNNVFWGIHTGSYYQFQRNAQKENDETQYINSNDLVISPYISLGKGKVQPVRSARTAMDILISLNKYGRLKHKPSKEEIDALAIVANEIEYKRFYDNRFKYIYQLEELDKSLQSMGLVDTADIVYFANLNDIWAYGNWQKRGAGKRFEGGFIPQFNGFYQNSEVSLMNVVQKDKDLEYGLYGFISFNRFEPRNYSWQSDIFVDLTFGKSWSEESEIFTSDNNSHNYYSTSNSWNGMLNLSWQFSYFPNTRTQLSLTPFSSYSFQKVGDSDGDFGISTGVYFSAYYYVSPRFRINALASVNYYNDFSMATPSPFWNTFLYRNQINNYRANNYRAINDVVTSQFYEANLIGPYLGYNLLFSISYAIF